MQCSERSEGVHGTVGEVRGEERALEYDDGRVQSSFCRTTWRAATGREMLCARRASSKTGPR